MVRTPSHPERDSAAKPALWRRLVWLAGIWTQRAGLASRC
ncbi:hypothetical protein PA2G_03375 [Pseudomonas aeruginosa 2192]|nr:hypothetical protein PA2G_03375 [Pseudomonas aeruginosa 2192]